MTAYTNSPHTKASWMKPIFINTSAADKSARHFGLMRSSCGHILGFAAVRKGKQRVLLWKKCK